MPCSDSLLSQTASIGMKGDYSLQTERKSVESPRPVMGIQVKTRSLPTMVNTHREA